MKRAAGLCLLAVAFALLLDGSAHADETDQAAKSQLLLAHYMPWYQAKPFSKRWGWHWTMNHFDPEKQIDGKREIASKYYPLIGPYDSADLHVLEYHLLLMKLAGIDGVIVDWYGLTDHRDYAALNHSTTQMLKQCERLNMKFVICYEDQTIPALVEAKRIRETDRVIHAAKEISWLNKYWFKSGAYVKLGVRPLLLSFGQTGLTDEEWSQCLKQTDAKVAYISQHYRRRAADGAFDWPVPSDALTKWDQFYRDSKLWPHAIPVAFPRFVDIYAEANVSSSYGRFSDDGGVSFRSMLNRAAASNAAIVQIATWNDWGEGTQIEPCQEFGYRDLEIVQEIRKPQFGNGVSPTPEDLQLPIRLLRRRRRATSDEHQKTLDRIARMITAGNLPAVRTRLAN